MIKVTLNGRSVITEPGKTILQLARENGIEIPTLCDDKELHPFGSCFVCAVEVKGARGFVTSCGTRIADGMEIFTDTPGVHSARKMALELLLSDHYADCVAPCKIACPAGVDVQSYVAEVANGNYSKAVQIIKESLPLPLSIGRVCPAFCEHECRRTLVEEPIAIRQLKRHAADHDLENEAYSPVVKPAKGKKVVVVGAGPSGLSCGWYLAQEGFEVKILESSPQAGGWLRYGIPEYRLPKTTLDKEVALLCQTGMTIDYNVNVGMDISLADLSRDYDAVYLAIGAQKAVPMPVKGAELNGVYLGVDFLRAHALGQKPVVGKKTAVIGGGNTAVDCARTAVRLGSEVTIVYRRTRAEMPAEEYEVDAAEHEGVRFYMLTNPVEFNGEGKLSSIKFEKMALGEPDASGRRRPEPTGEFFDEEFDTVIAAISQASDVDFLAKDENKINNTIMPLTRWQTAQADENTMFTGWGNVFAGGDFRRGPATAVEAIADGKTAADYIVKFIFGQEMLPVKKAFDSKKGAKLKEISPREYEKFPEKKRALMAELAADIRSKNFAEVETGFTNEQACSEAERCLECGCQVNNTCSLRKYGTDYEVDLSMLTGVNNHHPIDDSHPFIRRDANKCVKCGRCVRICTEVQGAGVLGYMYRGFISTVAPEFGGSLTETGCEACGKCIAVCPVGALTEKNQTSKLHPRHQESVVQNCGLCGSGCKVEIFTDNNTPVIIATPKEEGFNGRNLCFGGRFGWQYLTDNDRITTPLKKTATGYEPISWDEAGLLIGKNIKGNRHIWVSPTTANEPLLLTKYVAQYANATWGSLTFADDFTAEVEPYAPATKPFAELAQAQTLVVVGEINVSLRSVIRQHQRNGAKLILLNNQDNRFNLLADKHFADVDGTLAFMQVANSNCEPDEKKNLDLLLPNRTMFVYNRHNVAEDTRLAIWKLAAEVCDFGTGSGVIPLSCWSNTLGARKVELANVPAIKTDFALLWNESPTDEEAAVLNGAFTVAVSTHKHGNFNPDIYLPGSSYLDMNGSALADDGRDTRYFNEGNNDYFAKLVDLFARNGLISPHMGDTRYWCGQALSLLNSKPRPQVDKANLNAVLANACVTKGNVARRDLLRYSKLTALRALTKA